MEQRGTALIILSAAVTQPLKCQSWTYCVLERQPFSAVGHFMLTGVNEGQFSRDGAIPGLVNMDVITGLPLPASTWYNLIGVYLCAYTAFKTHRL